MDAKTWWQHYQDAIAEHKENMKRLERGELVAIETGGKIEYFTPEEVKKMNDSLYK